MFFPPSRNFLHWNEMIVEIVQYDCSELHQYLLYQGELLLNSMETFPWLHTSDHKFKDVAKQNIGFINLGMNNKFYKSFFLLFFLRIFSSFFSKRKTGKIS